MTDFTLPPRGSSFCNHGGVPELLRMHTEDFPFFDMQTSKGCNMSIAPNASNGGGAAPPALVGQNM